MARVRRAQGVAAEFHGQVALVTGGLGDIGLAIALELAGRGADVALCDRDLSRAEEFLERIRPLPGRGLCHEVDVRDAAAVQAWIGSVNAAIGTPSIIVPNAAIVHEESFADLSLERWQQQLDVNLNGALYVAMNAARRLIDAKREGRIVFVGSWAGHQVHPNIPAYCVSKAALRMLMRCMALEYAPFGILVNEVAPGFVDGGMGKPGPDEEASLRGQVPVGRLSTPEDVAKEVAHLCSPANRQMTGSTLLLDGGLSLVGRPPA
jgi:glucose 1-dehydrogenase